MKVKPVDPNAVIRDPITKLALPAEGGEVPDNVFWNRRLLAEEVRRLTKAEEAELEKKAQRAEPTGTEPVAPLTTRNRS